jgi:hypothetical protein
MGAEVDCELAVALGGGEFLPALTRILEGDRGQKRWDLALARFCPRSPAYWKVTAGRTAGGLEVATHGTG